LELKARWASVGIGEHKERLGIEIVGVVEDALYAGPRQGPRPMIYLPVLQTNYSVSASIYVRADGTDAVSLFPALRRIVARIDPALPVYEMKTLEGQLDETLSTERLIASLSVVFGALATVMAALGLYGVMAFVVARRTKEIGLRMALGAQRWSVSWLVLREVAALLCVGLSVGVPIAFAGKPLRFLAAVRRNPCRWIDVRRSDHGSRIGGGDRGVPSRAQRHPLIALRDD
jgi:predicted lysophospholipase L1 biosynthesis ABC-type transport system permease subunit